MYYGVEMKKWEKPIGGELLFSDVKPQLTANTQYVYTQSFIAPSKGVVSINCSAWYSYICGQHSNNVVTVTVNGVEVPTITLYDKTEYSVFGSMKVLFEVRKYDDVTVNYVAYTANGYSGYSFISYNGYLFKGLTLPNELLKVGTFTNTAASKWSITLDITDTCTINEDNSITMLKSGNLKIIFTPLGGGGNYGDLYKNGTSYMTFTANGSGIREVVLEVAAGDIISLDSAASQTISDGRIIFWDNEEIPETATKYGDNVYYLGTGNSFNIQELLPDIDYTTLTSDNFIVEWYADKSVAYDQTVSARGSSAYVEDITKTYDPTTGILNASATLKTVLSATDSNNYHNKVTMGVKAYLITTEIIPIVTVEPMTLTQRNSYSYSSGNYAISELAIVNKGWTKISASNKNNVQYASVYDNDTGTRIELNVTDPIDISTVKNIRLLLQSISTANVTANVTWNLS